MIKDASKPKASDLLKNVEYLFIEENSEEAKDFVRKVVKNTLETFSIDDPIQVIFNDKGVNGRIGFKGIDNIYSSLYEKYPNAIRSIFIKLLYWGVDYPMGFVDKRNNDAVDLRDFYWE